VLTVYLATLMFGALSLQVANVAAISAAWPHLAALALSLMVSLALFLRLATVAFSSARPSA
jgi:hypothetical protein